MLIAFDTAWTDKSFDLLSKCAYIFAVVKKIESVFSGDDKNKFGLKNEDYSEHKYNYAYNTYNKILLKEEKYDEEITKNFEQLISKITELNLNN